MSDEAWRRHLLATEVAADWLDTKPPAQVSYAREASGIAVRLHPVDPAADAAAPEACPTGADGQRPDDERDRGPPGDRG
jgi:hypothetical protein